MPYFTVSFLIRSEIPASFNIYFVSDMYLDHLEHFLEHHFYVKTTL